MANTKLTLDDIVDLRAYERQRDDFRTHVIAIKRLRRVAVGPIVTLVFENRDTIRFQIQEMVRAERMLSDEAVLAELETYNPLIPEPGQLSATLFVELTTKVQLEEWLPKLVGIERSIELLLGEGDSARVVRCVVEEEHAAQLTREEVTASVHYVRFELSPDEVEAFATGPAVLAVNHPAYAYGAPLSDETRAELLTDLR
ncbi:MAG TPA: DUF3501 family protein [Acidimicrobiales bacterium]|nr:DUF3501 family protein [Acidimicrobiales bacterium]